MNATARKNGLSPCLLVFGISPKMPMNGKEYPEQRRRMKVMKTARSNMLKVIARQRLATALKMSVPAAADRDTTIGSDVLLYKERLRNEWIGPCKVLASNKKNLLLSIRGLQFPYQSTNSNHIRIHITPNYRTRHSETLTLKWVEGYSVNHFWYLSGKAYRILNIKLHHAEEISQSLLTIF